MFDLYGLPQDTPGNQTINNSISGKERIFQLEKAISEDISDRRFIPHIQLYEYETLLFSDINTIDNVIGIHGLSQKEKLQEIINKAGKPEKINNNPNTAPSKRLQHIYPPYQKNPHNLLIIKKIPLTKIRFECPHFDSWLTKLENLAPLEERS